MRVKLKAMHKVVRREMAAVRRCDQLLREQDMTELQQQQLPKLISVLERVLPKWEKRERPAFFVPWHPVLGFDDHLVKTYGKS